MTISPRNPLADRVPQLLGLAIAVALLAGCGGTIATASSSTAASEAPSVGSAGSPAPSASQNAGASLSALLPHDDPGLEDRLPDDVDGRPLTKFSVGPITAAGNAGAEPIRTLVRQIGDGTGNFGLAYASDPATPTFNLIALRIPGAKSDELLTRYTGLLVADSPGTTTDRLTLGGKSVTTVSAPTDSLGDSWFYVLDDTVFGVQAGTKEQAATLLELLP
jgi:hypothetical protein